jgi:anti-anti-sigma factor
MLTMNSMDDVQRDRWQAEEPSVQLTLDIHAQDQVTIIHCRGRITYGREAAHLSEQIAQFLSETRQLILNLDGVEMIDSAGLGELVLVLMWAQASDCEIKLAAPSKNVRQLFDMTNLSSAFEIYASVSEALEGCQSPAA